MDISANYRKEIIRYQGSPWEFIKKIPLRLKFKFARGIFKVMFNPEKTEGIFEALDLVLKHPGSHTEDFKAYALELKKIASINELMEQKYLEPPVDLVHLANLNDGTIGKEYWRHLDRYKLDPIFYPDIPLENDLQWLSMRARQIHDIVHVICGFGTEVSDELGVQAYTLGQVTDPSAAMIIGGGLLNAGLKKPWTIPECIDAIIRGYHLGRSSDFVIGIKFSEIWEKPLNDLRAELGMPLF